MSMGTENFDNMKNSIKYIYDNPVKQEYVDDQKNTYTQIIEE